MSCDWSKLPRRMLEIIATQECLKRIQAVREGKNPYPEDQREFWWALETADRESLGDSYADFYDPRPLNRQVLEASGFTFVPGTNSVLHPEKDVLLFDRRSLGFGHQFDYSGGAFNHAMPLSTIGDFRRFCSLPGIEIDVIVPEDYKS